MADRAKLNFQYAKGSSVSDMRKTIHHELRRLGDARLVWVNEGDLLAMQMQSEALEYTDMER